MKIDQLLYQELQKRLSPRKIIFITRTKLFIYAYQQWHENCMGFLILYRHKESYYFLIMQALTLKIMFDMQLYSNFVSHSRFLGQQKCLVFLTPSSATFIKSVLVFESKQELTDLKIQLGKIYFIPDEVQQKQLSFFKKPQVQQLYGKADIDLKILQKDLLLRDQVEAQIKKYFRKLQSFAENQKKTGFKAYGLGRQQWKLQQDQKQYIKSKQEAVTIQNLISFNKQARVRGIKD